MIQIPSRATERLRPTVASLRLIQAIALLLLIAPNALSQIQTEPVEIISATPLSPFSDRAGLWPNNDLAQDFFNSESGSIEDRLNSVPGILAREAGSPTVSIRGSALADRVLKLYEGIPLNMADGVGASSLFLPSETLGTLRVFKGPASVYYGRSAMAGALDHRLRIFDRPAVRASVADDSGQFGTRNLLLAMPFGSKTQESLPSSQLTLFQERRPGEFLYRSVSSPNSGRRSNNGVDTSRATLATDLKRGPWSFKARGIVAQQMGSGPGSVIQPFSNTFDNTGTLVSAAATHDLSETTQLGLRLSETRIWGDYDRSTAAASTSFTKRSAASLDAQTLLFERAYVRTFLDLEGNSLAASYLGGTQLNEYDFDVGQSFEVTLTPVFSIQPGYRIDTRTGEAFKSLGVFAAESSSRYWATYGEGYRSPSLSDRYANVSYFKGNPNLKPERSSALEVGFLQERGQRHGGYLDGFTYGGAAYTIRYTDLIDTKNLAANVTTRENRGAAVANGFELSLGYGISVWNISANYNYLDAKLESNSEPLRLSPRHQASLAVAHQIGPVLFEARETTWSSYFDRLFTTNELREIPSWATFDFTVRTIGLMDWEVKGGVLNLFDEPRELTISYPEPQRRFFVSVLRYL